MKRDTLLVLSGDRKEFEEWVRKYGLKIKNAQIVHVTTTDDIKGDGSVYWTALKSYAKMKDHSRLELRLNKKYTFVSHEKLEEKLKGYHTPNHIPQDTRL